MNLDEDFLDIKNRIMINVKTRNLYFKLLHDVEKFLDIDLMALQEKGAIPTEELYKTELRKTNNFIEDFGKVELKNKLFEFMYYFLLICFCGFLTNMIKSFLNLEFKEIQISSVLMYLTIFAAVIATPFIIYRKEKRYSEDKTFSNVLIAIFVVGFVVFTIFSIKSGPIRNVLLTTNIIVYILIEAAIALLTTSLKKLSTK